MAEQILLVDDEEGIRKVLSIVLEDSGYEVVTAKSGEEALDLFRETHPPIVLTDIKMPGMDGIEVLRRIKEQSPETEVIMITGHGDIDLAIQSLKFDATDFITKPINDDVLEIALKRARERMAFRSERKRYTEDLEKLVEEKTGKLVQAERLAAVGQTVSALAHSIKNVMGGLRGGEFVLEKGIELRNEEYLRRGWGMVKGNLDRIREMALDLLRYGKDRVPEFEACDPNRPVREVADLMMDQARNHGISLVLDLDESLPPAWFDPEGIHRCILNLVTNAVDACVDLECSRRQGQVILRTLKSRHWAVEYQVEDSGCGMDQETKGKVFQAFFSTKGSRGTGLGLMITKKIVDEHGGTIDFESETGKGTRFVIRLPAKKATTQANAGSQLL